MSAESQARDDLAYQAIERAAAAGAPCPSNNTLCSLIGLASVGATANVVSRLEQRGLIRITRFQSGREVTIVSSGQSTARYHGKRTPHWRITGADGHIYRAQKVRADAMPFDRPEILPDPVHRDRCPRCGIRADIGCGHSLAPLSMGAFA